MWWSSWLTETVNQLDGFSTYGASDVSDAVVGRASHRRNAPDRTDRIVESVGCHLDPPLRSGHPTDRFLHQGPAEIVRAALQDALARFHTELDPRHLHVVDKSVEEYPRDGMHPQVVLEARARSGLPGEIDRRVAMDERKRNEFRESPGVRLDGGEAPDVRDPMRRGIHVPEHNRARTADPQTMCGADDLLPRVGRELPLGEGPADVVVQDLGGGPRDRVEPVRLRFGEELVEGDAELGRAVEDLHRAERVQMDPGDALLHGAREVEVEAPRQIGMGPALHADLRRAPLPRLFGLVRDLGQRERVRLRVGLALG